MEQKKNEQLDIIKFAKELNADGVFIKNITYENGELKNYNFNDLSKEQCELVEVLLICYVDYIMKKQHLNDYTQSHVDIIENILKLPIVKGITKGENKNAQI